MCLRKTNEKTLKSDFRFSFRINIKCVHIYFFIIINIKSYFFLFVKIVMHLMVKHEPLSPWWELYSGSRVAVWSLTY